jgi:hypothetical protein
VYNAIFEKVIEVTAKRPKMQGGVLLEYFPLQKVCSIPKNATPYNRSPYPSVMIMFRWSDDQPNDLEFARSSANELLEIVTEGNVDLPKSDRGTPGYTYPNYGELHVWLYPARCDNQRFLRRSPWREASVQKGRESIQ